MGFISDLRREFIARPDIYKAEIVFKWPDTNIRRRTQITVEQDEQALFFRDGTVRGILKPGVATLDSSELPFLGDLVDSLTGGNFFKTEIYFVSTREFPNLPFGGMVDNVIDPQTQLAVGLRVFGDYSLKVIAPDRVVTNLVGTTSLSSNDQITDWMRDQLLKVFRQDVVSQIAAQGWPILGIAARNADIESQVVQGVQSMLDPYGLALARMGNFTISIKPEDEDALKKFRRDVQYTKLAGSFPAAAAGEAVEGIGEGAAKGGGATGAAILGAGLGLGAGIVNAAGQAQTPAAAETHCPNCGATNLAGARFCSNCGHALAETQETTTTR